MKNQPHSVMCEFKKKSVVNFSSIYDFVPVVTIIPWKDGSGGAVVQFVTAGDGFKVRHSVNDTTWSGWSLIK